jgi:CRISPR-associated endonuclease/helicase Cas3
MTYFAHSENTVGHWHPLREHLAAVGKLAERHAATTPWAAEAHLAGLLHDLGKFGDLFQARLRGEASGLDHWSVGAQSALLQHRAVAAALAIEGHHIGLQAGSKDALRRLWPAQLQNRPLSDHDIDRLTERASQDGLVPSRPAAFALTDWEHDIAAMLDVRLLLSCLVDADFLDTEAHFEGDRCGKRYRQPGPKLDAQAALDAVLAHIQRVQSHNTTTGPVAEMRRQLLAACLDSATRPVGHYTLTAPTGSGKTLAMLAFALAHAARHGLKRVILAVPYLTIIEQTACIYRSIFAAHPQFGEGYVLEHHSMAGLGEEHHNQDNEGKSSEPTHAERQRRLLAQNWDAPIILTTNVQLLESLFSNRPGACRKLHNLIESVILFDEAQSLPQSLAVPTLAALSHLSAAYRTSVVFATATQPAFDTLDEAVKQHAVSGWKPGQIVEDHAPMFAALKRVEVTWPATGQETGWDALAAQLRATDRALCVVNLKRHALALMDALKDEAGVFHLSTNLCPEHRRTVLDNVRKQLATATTPCRLISTQCVEAGVDVDFPAAFRAFGPLEAIAQAAGRCNREGRLPGLGRVTVFDPVEEGGWRRRYPTFAYYQAAQVTRTLLAAHGDIDINDPKIFRDYYRRLYDLASADMLDRDLDDAIQALDFPAIARHYRLIEQDAIQVLVPYSAKRLVYDELRKEEERGIHGAWMRRAQGLAVSLYRPAQGHSAWSVLLSARLRRGGVSDEWFILEDPHGRHYDDTFGLRLPDSDPIFIA